MGTQISSVRARARSNGGQRLSELLPSDAPVTHEDAVPSLRMVALGLLPCAVLLILVLVL